jgi:hypothetical protein
LPNGTNAVPSIFLLDAEHKQLTLCERDAAGVWQVVRNIDLPVSDFGGLRSVQLGGTNAERGVLGQNAVAWLPLAGDVWEFTTLDGYDTPIKDGFLNDVTAGDLNGDGRKATCFSGNREKLSRPGFLRRPPQARARRPLAGVRAAHVSRRDNAVPEPREAVIGRRDRRQEKRSHRAGPRPHSGLSAGINLIILCRRVPV